MNLNRHLACIFPYVYGKIYIASQLFFHISDLVSNMGSAESIEIVEMYEGGWGKCHHKTFNYDFYINSDTKETSRTRPSGLKPLRRTVDLEKAGRLSVDKPEPSGFSAFPADFNEHNNLDAILRKAEPEINAFRKKIVEYLGDTTSAEVWCYPPIPQEGRRMVVREFLERFPRGRVYKVIQARDGQPDKYVQLTVDTPVTCYNDRFLFQTE